MSYRAEWKMLHLLNTSKNGKLHKDELMQMGVNCYGDTMLFLEEQKIVINQNDVFTLHPVVATLMNRFLVIQGASDMKEVYVDTPKCFVVMPFSEPWSNDVFECIKNALEEAAIDCIRGDLIPRVGKLTDNIVESMQQVGLVIADISLPNPNVFYELGIADTIGRDVFILFDKNNQAHLPADIQGAHYYAYDRNDLSGSQRELLQQLLQWKSKNCVDQILKYCG